MKELFADMAAYHLWADARLLERVGRLPEAVIEESVACSFPSLKKTFAHLLTAEHLWRQRLDSHEAARVEDSSADFSALASQLIGDDEWLVGWIENRPDAYFDEVIAYENTRKQSMEIPVRQILLQLFHHASYHRGQVVAIFHQLQVSDIPGTDYLIFKRR